MRRYERPHINEVWCGDSSVGPYLRTDDGKKHRVYVIALIDDASRFITGADVFFNDNFVNLMSVMKSDMVCSRLFDKADVKTVNRDSRGTHVCRYTLTHKLLLKKVPHQVITDTLGHKSKESDKPYLSMDE